MKNDNIQIYNVSGNKLISGINKVVEILKPTYGPGGSNVIIETDEYPQHRIANDGKVIVDSICLADPIEQMGKAILSEACEKQEKDCGDGRKTTCILTAAILNEGLKQKDIKPLDLKRQLDEALPIILKAIDEQKKEIKITNIGKIARIASESEEIGDLIGEIYPKIGREGIIELEASNIPSTYYEIVDGIRLHGAKLLAGWQSEPDLCVVEKPKVLICKEKIVNVNQLEAVYKKLLDAKITEVVLYCEDIEMAILSRLAQSNVKAINGENRIKTLVVKAPVLWKDWIYEDLAKMTDATAIDLKKGHTFESFKVEHLGSCGQWKATREDSRLNGTKNITKHIDKLKKDGLKDDQQLVRASWLNTKVAILKVGANTESELTWKIKKAKDATHAAYYALREGIVLGAGMCLYDIASSLDSFLAVCLQMPYHILLNNDLNFTAQDVYDPAIVVKSAISTAISLAGIILTTKGAIIIPQEIKDFARQMAAAQTPR